ncbi:MAG: hypothetical protein ACFFE4_16020 [Candidatus Thorarchaeota archaeon]
MATLNFLTLFNAILIYSSLYIISITLFFSEAFNIFLWKFSIISGVVSLLLTSLIYTFLKEYKKLPDFPFLIFIGLLGFLVGALLFPDSIQLNLAIPGIPPFFIFDPSQINYVFNDITGLIISIFQVSVLIYYFTLSLSIYSKARNKNTPRALIYNTIIFTVPIIMYIFYIVLKIPIFRELHILSLWVTIAGVCLMLLKKPDIFLELTNKIFNINIYHKSGILLYSYHFMKSQNEIDSTIWGKILIGLNHILSEFVDKQNQIDVLQTRNTDIIVHYDELGFAVVLITNKKNAILQKLMKNFTLEFRNKYKVELLEIQDLNKLINVSEFNETKELIEKEFQIYLS